MIIGCFALVEPFQSMARQFHAIAEMGIDYVDLTDNHNGGMLGVEAGFTASISLDAHPAHVRAMAEDAGLTFTSVCAHANLLDPPAPETYGTTEVIKGIRLAHLLGVDQAITTEGEPKTDFGRALSREEQLFAIREKLYWPVRWAAELGIELLIEPHGPVTDTVDGMAAILDGLGHEENVGICLDTGNSWLGGSEPLDYIKTFGDRIKHVHWKDMPAEMEAQRGELTGTGMAVIPLGDGVVGIEPVVQALLDIGFEGPTTLEVAGVEAVKTSAERLRQWAGE
jgi:inosose dehydratase